MTATDTQAEGTTAQRGSLFTRLRSYFIFLPLVYLCTGVFGVVALFCSVFDGTGRVQHRIARLWARSLLKVTGIRVRVEGLEHLASAQVAVYAVNHLSAIDIPVLYASLPGQFRIMAKKGLFRYPFLGWYLKRSGQIPIVLGDAHASLRSLNRACDALRRGMPLVVFPEGGRSASGRLQDFMQGAFYVAIRAQDPVLPMALVGTYELLPMNSFHALPGEVRLVIGAPIATKGMRVRDTGTLATQARQQIAALYDSHGKHGATEGAPNSVISTSQS